MAIAVCTAHRARLLPAKRCLHQAERSRLDSSRSSPEAAALRFSQFLPGEYRFSGASSKTDVGIGRVVGYVKPLNFWRPSMARGTVKWFNPTKGYGFIQPQGGGKDVFVHISAVEKAGLTSLNEGQSIEYEEVSNRGKTSAENLKVQR